MLTNIIITNYDIITILRVYVRLLLKGEETKNNIDELNNCN